VGFLCAFPPAFGDLNGACDEDWLAAEMEVFVVVVVERVSCSWSCSERSEGLLYIEVEDEVEDGREGSGDGDLAEVSAACFRTMGDEQLVGVLM